MLKFLADKKRRLDPPLSAVLVRTRALEYLLKVGFDFETIVEAKPMRCGTSFEIVVWDLERPAFVESFQVKAAEFAELDDHEVRKLAREVGWRYRRLQDAWQGDRTIVWC